MLSKPESRRSRFVIGTQSTFTSYKYCFLPLIAFWPRFWESRTRLETYGLAFLLQILWLLLATAPLNVINSFYNGVQTCRWARVEVPSFSMIALIQRLMRQGHNCHAPLVPNHALSNKYLFRPNCLRTMTQRRECFRQPPNRWTLLYFYHTLDRINARIKASHHI